MDWDGVRAEGLRGRSLDFIKKFIIKNCNILVIKRENLG